jgi:hypothetical protein
MKNYIAKSCLSLRWIIIFHENNGFVDFLNLINGLL